MFNTEVNHLFQLLDNSIVYWFLNIVSIIGSIYSIMFIIFALIAGVDFRKGFIVAYIFCCTIIMTVVLKNYFDYPRPLAIDSTLNSFGEEKVETDLSNLQPATFFGLFSDELLAKTRESNIARTGFPSGHTSSQIAIWISLALLMRKRWLWVFSISFVVLTMISRLYLAQHFLGDVIGGLFFSSTLVAILYFVVKMIKLESMEIINKSQVAFFILPIVLIPFYKVLPSLQTGSLIGFSLAFILIINKWGNPKLSQEWWRKSLNIVLYFVPFVILFFMSKAIHLPQNGFLPLCYFILISFISLLLSTQLSKLLKLSTT